MQLELLDSCSGCRLERCCQYMLFFTQNLAGFSIEK